METEELKFPRGDHIGIFMPEGFAVFAQAVFAQHGHGPADLSAAVYLLQEWVFEHFARDPQAEPADWGALVERAMTVRAHVEAFPFKGPCHCALCARFRTNNPLMPQ